MNIVIKPKKNRYIIYAFIIAIFSTVGINISLLDTNADKILKKFEYSSAWNNFMAVFRVSISRKNDRLLFYQMAAVGIFLLFLIIFSYRFSIREIISSAIVSVVFGMCMWIGTVFHHKESWDYFLRNKYVKFLGIWYILAYAVFVFGLLLIVGRFAIAYGKKEEQKTGIRTKKIHSTRKIFCMCVIALFICWLPYYISMWPGTIHGDFVMQVLQLFHYPTVLQGKLTSDGVNVLYSNDHPFIHTQLVGIFIKLGIKINNKALGYGIYTFLQMTAYICGISAIITALYHFKVNHSVLKVVLGVYALFPVFPMYAIMVGGDSFFALFFLWFMLGILWIFETRGEVLKNIKFDIFFAIIVFLMSAAKNQGIYVAIISLICCVICLKKYRIKILVTMFVPIFLFQFAYTGLIFKAAHVSTVGKQEALSFCFQQTARYVKYHGDEVTEEEKEAIDKVLIYKKLAEKYRPDLSDPVKITYKKEATSEELNNYFKIWIQMGLKHPEDYFQAFFANTYGYYSPMFNNYGGLYMGLSTVRFYRSSRKWAQKMIPASFCTKVDFKEPKVLSPIREKMRFLMAITYRIPIVNWFYNPGVITWMILLAFFALWTRRKYFDMAAFLPVFLIICVCLLSPKNNNLRYIYPACVLVPAMIATIFKNSDL